MIDKTKTKSVEAKLFFVAFLVFAAVVVGSVKNAYDGFLEESYFIRYPEYRGGE